MGEKGWEVGWAWMVSSKSLRSLSHQGKHSMNHRGSLMGTSRHFIPWLFRSLSLVSATPSAWPLELFWFSLFPPFSCLCGQHRAMARALKEAEHRECGLRRLRISAASSPTSRSHMLRPERQGGTVVQNMASGVQRSYVRILALSLLAMRA